VQVILQKNLHAADEEAAEYTSSLMDKLEALKAAHAQDDAVVDDVAGQAYVEQFGLELFQRADNAMRANSVTKQTADTFSAASTILDLVQIWPPPDAEVTAKVKFAKFHAVRIFKAIQKGEDPNDGNPEPAPIPTEDAVVQLDPEDPEVKDITVSYEQPTVEGEALDVDTGEAAPPAWNAASLPRPLGETTPQLKQEDNDINQRQNSIGGGYFPEVPTPIGQEEAPDPDEEFPLPSAASHDPTTGIIIQPPSRLAAAPDFDPQDFYKNDSDMDIDTQPSAPPASSLPPPTAPIAPPTTQQTRLAPQPPAAKPLWSRSAASTPKPVTSASKAPPPATNGAFASNASTNGAATEVDDAAIADAQKHAKWAISALNFEDVPTAIKELKIALAALGGA
jgi:vacuolar protein sorting-associated protein VTA1